MKRSHPEGPRDLFALFRKNLHVIYSEAEGHAYIVIYRMITARLAVGRKEEE